MATVCATGCTYVSLVEALSLVSPGEVLELLSDPQVEIDTVEIDVPVTIRGTGVSALDLRGAPGLEVNVAGVRLEDLALVPTTGRRLVEANAPAELTLVNVTAAGADTLLPGSVLYLNGATATLEDCTFTGNDTTESGGVVAGFNGSSVTLRRCTLDGNHAGFHGGAIYLDNSDLVVEASTFVADEATVLGGAAAVTGSGSTVAVTGSTFEGNAATDGAALHVSSALAFSGSGNTFCDDRPLTGGGVTSTAANFSWVDNVHRDIDGSAIVVAGGQADVHDCDLVGSDAGLDHVAGSVTLRNVLLAWNGVGVVRVTGTANLSYDAFWQNGYDTVGVGTGKPLVTDDPLVTYTPGDCGEVLVRDPASPLLGAGDPTLPDQDIGAGTGAPTTTTTTTTSGPTTGPTTPETSAAGDDRSPSETDRRGGPAGCGCGAGRPGGGLVAWFLLATRGARPPSSAGRRRG